MRLFTPWDISCKGADLSASGDEAQGGVEIATSDTYQLHAGHGTLPICAKSKSSFKSLFLALHPTAGACAGGGSKEGVGRPSWMGEGV